MISRLKSNIGPKAEMLPLVVLILVGTVSFVTVARWIDGHRPTLPRSIEEESLYLNGNTARRISLGFNGLAADWYWMCSLQYVGKKIMDASEQAFIDDLGQLNLKLLPALLDSATTLDPRFMEPYKYAAVVLPSINLKEAIRITNKGIDENPGAWQLYQHLGYIYWQQQDYKTASETYAKGARVPGAPRWMEAMSARMAAEGGSRGVAREIYGRMYQEAGDDQVREMAKKRLWQLDSLDQRDNLRQVLTTYKSRLNACPSSWRQIEPVLRSLRFRVDQNGSPVDPSGAAYILNVNECEAEPGPNTAVPIK
jgi:tetratricopeptide (TPR) repeat protein